MIHAPWTNYIYAEIIGAFDGFDEVCHIALFQKPIALRIVVLPQESLKHPHSILCRLAHTATVSTHPTALHTTTATIRLASRTFWTGSMEKTRWTGLFGRGKRYPPQQLCHKHLKLPAVSQTLVTSCCITNTCNFTNARHQHTLAASRKRFVPSTARVSGRSTIACPCTMRY
jgi:hypothetical protein